MAISRSYQCNILYSFTAISRPLRSIFSLHTTQVTCNMECRCANAMYSSLSHHVTLQLKLSFQEERCTIAVPPKI